MTPDDILRAATALYSEGRLEEAEGVFAQGVRAAPFDQRLQESLANLRWLRGQGATFARDYEAAVAERPNALALRLNCVNLIARAGFRDRAETLLRDGLACDPGNISIFLSLGALLDELGRPEEGLALLRRVAAKAPDAPSLAENMTAALLRVSRTEEALALIQPARKREPHNGEWIAYESMALRQLNDPRYHELCDYDAMVRIYDLPPPPGYRDAAAFNHVLAEALAPLHITEAHPLGQSPRGGSQTTKSLLRSNDPVIQAYIAALREPIRAYIDAMPDGQPDHPWSGRKTQNVKLSGCWSIRLKPGGFHVNHLHPAGWLSSAYYVRVPAAIASNTDQQGWIKFGEPRWPTPGCGVERTVQPQQGRLVLFPSYMWHGTIPFSEGERLTAPFDVVPA